MKNINHFGLDTDAPPCELCRGPNRASGHFHGLCAPHYAKRHLPKPRGNVMCYVIAPGARTKTWEGLIDVREAHKRAMSEQRFFVAL